MKSSAAVEIGVRGKSFLTVQTYSRPILGTDGSPAFECEPKLRQGGKMRIIALLVLLFGFSEVALAQTPECKSTRAADLLACYENGAPPLAAIKHPAPKTATASHKPAASKAPADQEQVVDFLEAENSKLDAKLRTICRGC